MSDLTAYAGDPAARPHVECSAPNGECVIGYVVQAVWLDDGSFDTGERFIVKDDDDNLITVSGWNVDTEIVPRT